MRINANNCHLRPAHGQPCRVIETRTLWGETTCRVWLPGRDSVLRIPASRLASPEDSGTGTADGIVYVASAARVADALTQDALLTPIESSVIPLRHQIKALSRAISGDRIRYLPADEVELEKTIAAGFILRELKLRGRVKRVPVIVPKGLVTQWVAGMSTHFNEGFRLLIPSDFSAYRRIAKEDHIRQGFRSTQYSWSWFAGKTIRKCAGRYVRIEGYSIQTADALRCDLQGRQGG